MTTTTRTSFALHDPVERSNRPYRYSGSTDERVYHYEQKRAGNPGRSIHTNQPKCPRRLAHRKRHRMNLGEASVITSSFGTQTTSIPGNKFVKFAMFFQNLGVEDPSAVSIRVDICGHGRTVRRLYCQNKAILIILGYLDAILQRKA